MVEQTSGPKLAARAAGVIVVVALIVGGYFAFLDKPVTKPSSDSVAVTVVPDKSADGAAKPADTAAAPAATPADTAAAPAPAATDSASTSADAAPASSAPAAAAPDGKPAAPSFDVVRVEPSGDTVAAGLAEPNSSVEVLDGSTPIGKGEANERGEWAIVVDKPLDPGTHDLSVRTTSSDKKTEMLSEQRVAVEVPDQNKGAPLVVLNDPDNPSRVLQVPKADTKVATAEPGATPAAGTPAAGGAPSTEVATANPAAGTPPAVSGSPGVTVDAVEFEAGKIYIAGSAAMGGTVRIYIDGVVIGDVQTDSKGRWLIEAKRSIAPGRHTVRVDQIDKGTGEVLVRAEVPFDQTADVATLMPMTEGGGSGGAASTGAVPGPQSVIIHRGDNLWTISRRLYGHGVRFSTIYEANSDQIRDPDWIYPGQVFVLPAGDTRWTN